MNTGDIWLFIGIAAVSFFILLKLPNRCWTRGRICTSIFESLFAIAALVLSVKNGKEGLFFFLMAAITIAFAAVFVRSDKKLGVNIISAVFFGIVQSVLSLFGGIALLVALGRAVSPQSAPQTSAADDFDAKKHAVLEQAEWVAREKGYIDANDWAARNGESDASSAYGHGFFDDKVN